MTKPKRKTKWWPTTLGGGSVYVYREGDYYVAYFYEPDGARYRYGSDLSFENLVARVKRQGLTDVHDMAHNDSRRKADATIDAFMSLLEDDEGPKRKQHGKIKIKRKR